MKTTIAAGLLFISCFLGGVGYADEPIVIKFSHVVAQDTPKGKAAERFKQLAESLTDGRVLVEIYPNSQLYRDKEELEALQMGAVQMLAPITSKFGPLGVRAFEVLDLPYLFTSIEALRVVTQGAIGQQLLKQLESKGVVGLAYWDNGFRVLSSNKPLRVPADIKGQKIRINSSKVNDAIIRSVSALPQTMGLSEVYHALQTGVVDGADGNLSNLYTQKHFEVQKYVVDTAHTYSGYAVVVNKQFWEDLPADIRDLLVEAMKGATLYNNQEAKRDDDFARKMIIESGRTTIYVPTPEEKAQWINAMLPVQKRMASRVSQEIIDLIHQEVANIPPTN